MILEHAARPLDRGHICYSLAFTDNADPLRARWRRAGNRRAADRSFALPLPRIKF
jgi:hypothetical protein